jgi:hypothetical protein
MVIHTRLCGRNMTAHRERASTSGASPAATSLGLDRRVHILRDLSLSPLMISPSLLSEVSVCGAS